MADSGPKVTLLVPQSGTTQPIEHPRATLPFSGFDVGTALILAALLFVVGTLLLTLGRRPALSPSRRTS